MGQLSTDRDGARVARWNQKLRTGPRFAPTRCATMAETEECGFRDFLKETRV